MHIHSYTYIHKHFTDWSDEYQPPSAVERRRRLSRVGSLSSRVAPARSPFPEWQHLPGLRVARRQDVRNWTEIRSVSRGAHTSRRDRTPEQHQHPVTGRQQTATPASIHLHPAMPASIHPHPRHTDPRVYELTRSVHTHEYTSSHDPCTPTREYTSSHDPCTPTREYTISHSGTHPRVYELTRSVHTRGYTSSHSGTHPRVYTFRKHAQTQPPWMYVLTTYTTVFSQTHNYSVDTSGMNIGHCIGSAYFCS